MLTTRKGNQLIITRKQDLLLDVRRSFLLRNKITLRSGSDSTEDGKIYLT